MTSEPNISPTPAVESRTYVRIPAEIPILVIARWNGATKIIPGRCADLSENGMGLTVPMSLVLGQSISIELKVPYTKQLLKLEAVVRHKVDHHCGCQFVDASPEQRRQFRRLAEMD